MFQIVAPDRAYFGEKDYQQLVLIRQMVEDLNLDVRIEPVPIVREPDGMAMSSRNRYLDAEQREQATALSSAMLAGRYAAAGGGGGGSGRRARRSRRGAGPGRRLPGGSGQRVEPRRPRPARMLVAARLGTTRLLDNIPVDLSGSASGAGHDGSEMTWRN